MFSALRHALAAPALALLAAPTAAQFAPVERAVVEKRTKFEDEIVRRIAERAARPGDSEREVWVRFLGKAFPGKAGPGLTDADFAQWYGLLAGEAGVWTLNSAPRPTDNLFERVAKRYGRTPRDASVGRDEFVGYAREFLTPDRSPPWKPVEPGAEAEKLFRGLDLDHNGAIDPVEMTDGLAAGGRAVDTNGDGRIDPGEYRAYLDARLGAAVQAEAARVAEVQARKAEKVERITPPAAGAPTPDPRAVVARPVGPAPPNARRDDRPQIPAWFSALDADHDGQVGLYEWRRAGLPLDQFAEMDLNEDGLLPLDELRRFARDHAPDGVVVHLPGESEMASKGGKRKDRQ